jgi:hypothetical protein
MERTDYTAEAEALFRRFAERHGLSYEVETGVPMDVCWSFPEQPRLSQAVTLGFQNADELNFGVDDFWSYFFPFEKVADKFERILDAWVEGDARVAVVGPKGRILQIRDGQRWKSIYRANRLLPIWRPALRTIQNEPTS